MNNSNVDKTIYKYDTFNKVFCFLNLYKSASKCARNVGWKASVQRYNFKRCINVANTYEKLKSNTYKSKPFYTFNKVERGKPRLIRSNHISDRVVQKCLCDYSLVLVLRNKLIYDNSATLKHKGCEFAMNRLKLFMRKQDKPYYTLTMDFHSYFENINHEILLNEVFKYYTDYKIKNLITHFIKMFGEKGLGLGSQVSQICAVFYTHTIDNYIKHIARHKYYVRYMDDSIIIDCDKKKLKTTLLNIKSICDNYKIELNLKKTSMSNSTKGCNFLKRHWNKTNKLYVRPDIDSYYRMFRKLKKFVEWKLPKEEIEQSFESWKSHFIHDNAKTLLYKANKKYNMIIGEHYD